VGTQLTLPRILNLTLARMAESRLWRSVVKHPEAVKQEHLPTQGQVKITDAFSAATKLPNSSKGAKELNDAIGYFIAKDMQPVSVVQGAGFQYVHGETV